MAAEEKIEAEVVQPTDRHSVLSQQFDEAEETEKAERARDESGKFAKGEKAAPKEPTKVAQAKSPATPNTQGQPAPEGDPVWKRPPASWKKETHDLWKTADPRLQEYAYSREEQMRAGVEPLKTKAEFADQINQVIEPYLPTIRGLGIDAPTAIGALMRADFTLRNSDPQSKRAYFLQLAQQYGVDLSGVQQDAPRVDPMAYALQNQFLSLKGEVETWKQQQEQAQNAQYLNEINKFSANAEHFEALRPAMIQLLQSGVAENLEDAYKKALRLDENLFDAEQSRKQVEQTSAKKDALNKAAQVAKAAAVSVKTSTPGKTATPKAQDRRAVLEEAFSNAEARI